MAKWPIPVFKVPASDDHKALAELYAQMREACTAYSEFIGEATERGAFTERELKHLDFGTVCLRIGYKQIKGVLTKAGAETGRKRLTNKETADVG